MILCTQKRKKVINIELEIENNVQKTKKRHKSFDHNADFFKAMELQTKGYELLDKNDPNGMLYNAIYERTDYAHKYDNVLRSIVNKCMREESYEHNFYYINYNKENNTYYLDYYEDGHRTREKIPKKLAREKYNFGGIYAGTGKDDLHRYDNMISAIVTSVNSELFKLEYCE